MSRSISDERSFDLEKQKNGNPKKKGVFGRRMVPSYSDTKTGFVFFRRFRVAIRDTLRPGWTARLIEFHLFIITIRELSSTTYYLEIGDTDMRNRSMVKTLLMFSRRNNLIN